MKKSSWFGRLSARNKVAEKNRDSSQSASSPPSDTPPSEQARVELLEARVLYSADVLGILPHEVEALEPLADQVSSLSQTPVSQASVSQAPVSQTNDNDTVLTRELSVFAKPTLSSADLPLSELTALVGDEIAEADDLRRTIKSLTDNEAPSLTGFPLDSPVYIETGSPVVLAPDLVVSDPELDALDNYDGFSIVIERSNSPSANDQFDLGAYGAGTNIVNGGPPIGKQVQNGNGVLELLFDTPVSRQTVEDVLRAISYLNADVSGGHSQVDFNWTVNDNNTGGQGSGGALAASYTTSLNIVPSHLVAESDDLGVVVAGTPLSIAQNALLDNDTGLLAASAQVIDVTAPNAGSVSNNLVYTSNVADTGPVSFDYTAMAGNSTLVSQWNLITDGTDDTGPNSGITHSDSAGDLVFDGNDYIELPNIVYPDTFVLTFDFKINNLDNDQEQVFFAHGEYRAKNSLLVWATGNQYTDASDRGKLWTYIRDSNDADDTFGFGIDITGLDHSIWHSYTIVVEKDSGAKVWIDDTLHIDAPRSGANFQPTMPAYIGTELDSGTLQYFLADYEMADLRLLDGYDGTLNQFSTATVSLDLRNEEVVVESSFAVDEDVTRTLLVTELQTTDIDTADSDLIYEITGDATFGKLILGSAELAAGDVFTQEDINLGNVHFRHDGDQFATSDSMDLIVDDGEGSQSTVDLQITLQPVNDAPVFVADGFLAGVAEGSTDPTGASIENIFQNSFSDAETPVGIPFDGIAITSNADVTHGDWQYRINSSSAWTDIGTSVSESAALMLARTAFLRFVADENYHGNAPDLTVYAVDSTYSGNFSNTVGDEYENVSVRGGTTPFSTDSAVIDFTISSVNDAPTLSDGSIANIDEDDIASAGDTIGNIFTGRFSDADTGSSFAGIAVSADASSTTGDWQYSTNGGTNWHHFVGVSSTDAVLLGTSAMLRFVPAQDFNGNGTPLQVHAIDDTYSGAFTTGASQRTLDVTINGDGTPVSTSSAAIPITVDPVFDPPYFAGTLPVLVTVNEDEDSVVDVSGLSVESGDWPGSVALHLYTSGAGLITAPDMSATIFTGDELYITATGVAGINNFLTNQTITYRHLTEHTEGDGVDTFSYRLVYNSGDVTPSNSVNININSVNDAPELVGYDNAIFTTNEDTLVELTLDDIDGTSTDVEDGSLRGLVVQPDVGPGVGTGVSNGSLWIGSNAGAADPWAEGSNDTINASNNGYWLPPANQNGEIAAFTVRGIDSEGLLSDNTASVIGNVSAVNDPPTQLENTSPLPSASEDSLVKLTLAELISITSAADIEGGIGEIKIDSLPIEHTLYIGPDSGSWNEFQAGVHDTVNSTDHAYWLPQQNLAGNGIEAFSVIAIDDQGLSAQAPVKVNFDLLEVNDAPTIATATTQLHLVPEDSTTRFTLSELIANVQGDDIESSITELVVQSVPAGHELWIGQVAGSAQRFDAGVVDTIDASNHAWWTPQTNLFGETSAFTVIARDSEGLSSIGTADVRIDVLSVNDAPVIASTVAPLPTVPEDSTTEFTLAELIGHVQGGDVEGTIADLVVESVPVGHDLWIGPDRGLAQQFVAGVVDTIDGSNKAWWTPASNLFGETTAFTVSARDNDGLSSVGSADVRVDVASVNDAPVITSTIVPLPTVSEDSTTEFTLTELIGHVQGSDVEGAITALVVESVPVGHELWIGSDRGLAQPFDAGVVDTIDGSNNAWWIPESNLFGETTAFTVTARDNEGLSSAAAADVRIDLTPVNDAPTIASTAVPLPTVLEDSTTEFTLAEVIGHIRGGDVDGTITELVVTGVPSGHDLWIGPTRASAQPFEAGVVDTIDGSNNVWWTPEANLFGETIAFSVSARDNDGLSSVSTADVRIDITPVNDAPVIESNSVPLPTVLEDSTTQYTLADLTGYLQGDDVDGSITELIVETVPVGHELWIGQNTASAQRFSAGVVDTIDASNSAWWKPLEHGVGEHEAFTVRAKDNSGEDSISTAAFMVDVIPVNDAPVAINNTRSVTASTVYSLHISDVGFADVVESHELSAIQITSLPVAGQLLLQETPVIVGQEISASSINAGLLRYVSPANIATSAVTDEVGYRVRDAGGTANGGVDVSASEAILRLNVVASDSPPIVEATYQLPFLVDENAPAGTVVGGLAAIDPDPVFSHLHNGNFDTGAALAPDVNRYAEDGSWGGANIGQWNVVSGNVELRGDLWQSGPDGGHPLDLNGDTPGAIAQQIVTKSGAPYTLEFALAGNFRSSHATVSVEVEIGTQTFQLQVNKNADWSEQNPGWQQQSIPFVAEGPGTTITFRSLEGGAFGPLIADVSVYDQLAFEVADPNLPFEISADNELITTGSTLDHETIDSYSIDVRVSELDGLETVVSYPVLVNDLNESPELHTNATLQTIVDSVVTIGPKYLAATDVDAADQTADSLVYTLTTAPASGQLLLNNNPLTSGDSFSQADIDQRRLTWQSSVSGTDAFSFHLEDGGEDAAPAISETFNIEIYAPLELRASTLWQMSEAESMPLSAAQIDTTGGFYEDQHLLISVTDKPDSVLFFQSGVDAPVTTFSMQMLKNGDVSLQHDGTEPDGRLQQIGLTLTHVDDTVPLFVESASIDLQVDDVANAPVGTDSEMATDHKTALTFTTEQLGFDDLDDGDSLKAVIIEQEPVSGDLLLSGQLVTAGTTITAEAVDQGALTYRPDPQMVGTLTDTVLFRLIDSGDTQTGGTNISANTNSIAVVVTSDHEPVAYPDNIIVDEGGVVSSLVSGDLSVLANDEDLDTTTANLRVILVDLPQYGELQLRDDGTFSYRHDRSETVSDRFSYSVVDQSPDGSYPPAAELKTWVDIAINPVDDRPIAGVADDQSVIAGRYFEFSLPSDLFRAYYPGDELQISSSQADGAELPAWLHYDEVAGVFSGVPNLNEFESLDIQVTATDPDGATAQITFRLVIEPSTGAAEAEATPVQDGPRSVTDEASSEVKPASVSEGLNANARQSSLETADIMTDRQSSSSAADSSPLVVFADNRIERSDLIEFEDKIVKHTDKDIVREVIEEVAIVVDALDTIDLRQLYIASDTQLIGAAKKIIDQLDRNRDELSSVVVQNKIVFNGAATLSAGLSLSYVLWLLKSGMLLSSALSAMPAWRLIDPVPILQDYGSDGDGEDESLESMVEENPDDDDDSVPDESRRPETDTDQPGDNHGASPKR